MRWVATRKEEQNEAAVDPWTVVHLAAGLASGLVGWSFSRSIVLALGYEVVEQAVERTRSGRRFFHSSRPESTLNAITDLAVFAVGHRLGRAWNETAATVVPEDGPEDAPEDDPENAPEDAEKKRAEEKGARPPEPGSARP